MVVSRSEPPLPPPSNFSTATYSRLVDLYTPYSSRSRSPSSSHIAVPDLPPPYSPPTTITVRARSRTISDTDSRRSKRRHLDHPIPIATSSRLPPHSTSSRSTLRTKRLPAQSITSHGPINTQISSLPHSPADIPSCPESPSLDTETDAMSFLNPATNYLAAKLDVNFENGGLVEMVGGPNTGSCYSLSGYVNLTIPALPKGAQGRQREVREFTVTMESMQDYHDDHGRYTPFRLHTFTASIPVEPLVIPSHDTSRPNDTRIHLTIPFDLRLPGWLPPTHTSRQTKIDHGVTAKITVGWMAAPLTLSTSPYPQPQPEETYMDCLPSETDTLQRRPSGSTRKSRLGLDQYFFPNASLSARTTATSSSRHTSFNVIRHRLPAAITQADRPNERQYTLRPEADPDSPVECVVLCPDWVDVNGPERSLKIALRLRAKHQPEDIPGRTNTPESDFGSTGSSLASVGGGEADAGGSRPMSRARGKTDEVYTHVLELGMEVEEVERFSSTPITSWGQSFPVPPEQPNRSGTVNPLLASRSTYADIGVIMQNDSRPHRAATTRPCLLADDGSQRNFFFAGDGLSLADKWRKVNVVLPMPATDSKQKNNRPQSELDSPFLRVRHNLKIKMVCRNTGSDETKIIVLTTPIRFGTLPTTHPDSKLKSESHLPVYIQLFHENGDLRECDPLPIYTKDEPDGDIIMSEPPAETPTLPAHKPVSPGVAPLPPLITRATTPTPPVTLAFPLPEDDYVMESDSSEGSESEDGDSESSEGSTSASVSASVSASGLADRSGLGMGMGEGSSSGASFMERELAREREHRSERERERQRERDRDRMRRMEAQRERERERETRSQAPPPTPRTPGARKPARTPRTVRAVG